MTLYEKINYRFPKLANQLYRFYTVHKTTVWQDMLICTAVSAVCAFYEFEAFFMPAFMNNLRYLFVFLFVCCWVYCSFLNGFRKRYIFLAFTAAFWFIPRLIIIWEESTPIINYSKYLDAAAQFSRLMAEFSLNRFAILLNTPMFYALIALLMWCFFAFLVGLHINKNISRDMRKKLVK